MKLRPALAVAAVTGLLASACGGGSHEGHSDAATPKGEPGVDRTVEVAMVDIGFQPAQVEVKRGETVRFVFANRGQAPHDAFIGDAPEQAEHEAMMRSDTGAGHEHGDGGSGDAVTVEPGKSATLVRTFTGSDSLEIGCHQPGHYAAGMRLPITVV